MNLLRLSYAVTVPDAPWHTAHYRCQVLGDPASIFHLWMHLTDMGKLPGARPRHITVLNLAGVEVDMTRGLDPFHSAVAHHFPEPSGNPIPDPRRS